MNIVPIMELILNFFQRKRKLGELKTQYDSGVKRLKTTEERLVKAKVGKEETVRAIMIHRQQK